MFPRWFNLILALAALIFVPITIHMGKPLHAMVWGTVALLEIWIYWIKGE